MLAMIGDHEAARAWFQRAAAIRRRLAERTRALVPGGIGTGRRRSVLGGFRGPRDPFNLPGMSHESPTRQPPEFFESGRSSTVGGFPRMPDPTSNRGGFNDPILGFNHGRPGQMDPLEAMRIVRQPTHPWSVRERTWMMLRAERLSARPGAGAAPDPEYLLTLDEAREQLNDPAWIAYARCLRGLAAATAARGDRDAARRLRLLSVGIGLEASDPSEATRPEFAEFLEDFVGLLEEAGDLDLAEAMAVASVLYRRSSRGERHPEYAAGLARLAGVLRARGDRAQALLLYEKALAIRREAMAADRPELAEVLLAMAELYDDLGDPDEARRAVGRALAISDALLDRCLPALPERQQLAMLALRERTVSVWLDLTARGRADAGAYEPLVRWKGITIEVARGARAAATKGTASALRAELARAREGLNKLYYLDVPADQAREHARRIREQVEKSADLEARLAEAVGWKPARIRPDEVRAALPAGAAFVDIYHYHRRGRPARPAGPGPFAAGPAATRPDEPGPEGQVAGPEGHYVAFVVRRGAPTARVELGPAAPIDREVRAWLDAIDHRADPEPSGLRLARAVWAPVANVAGDAAAILVAPDGALNFLPWGALPDERPHSYLIERRAFAVVPSSRQLAGAARSAAPGPTPAAGGLLAVGGVEYGRGEPIEKGEPLGARPAREVATLRAAAVGTARIEFPRLEGTLKEVDAVAEVYRKGGAGPVTLLTGARATKERLRSAMPGRRVLQLATHGYFAAPELASALGPGAAAPGRGWDEMSRDDVVGYHPGLLSGLAWAGAAAPAADPATGLIDRGSAIMTAEEVAALDLNGCDLAVLSACKTGLGRSAGGEGVLGLQRAFLLAGARTVIASLWRVDDAATCVLMEQFHANLWVKKLPKLEALRRAQLTVLNDPEFVRRRYEQLLRDIKVEADTVPHSGDPMPGGSRSHPALWAAFVLGGDGG
jgi:CHAT domain-containing protein/tetratricopeptide (TPR) repeat protein